MVAFSLTQNNGKSKKQNELRNANVNECIAYAIAQQPNTFWLKLKRVFFLSLSDFSFILSSSECCAFLYTFFQWEENCFTRPTAIQISFISRICFLSILFTSFIFCSFFTFSSLPDNIFLAFFYNDKYPPFSIDFVDQSLAFFIFNLKRFFLALFAGIFRIDILCNVWLDHALHTIARIQLSKNETFSWTL